jgi:pyruvate formate lyase activating enzyme
MIIKGLQKTTLLDFPGKLACTIFTAGCNFRCPFCHNSSLVVRAGEVDEIPMESFLSYISKRKGLLDGVAITGGEPLLNPDIDELMRKIREALDGGYFYEFYQKYHNLLAERNPD